MRLSASGGPCRLDPGAKSGQAHLSLTMSFKAYRNSGTLHGVLGGTSERASRFVLCPRLSGDSFGGTDPAWKRLGGTMLSSPQTAQEVGG